MPRRASDDPFFTAPDWDHPSQSIAANMRRRSAASSRADQAKIEAERTSVLNLREIFVTKQRDYDSLETAAAGYKARIAALEAQLAKLSSDLLSVTTEDVAVASDDPVCVHGVREGRVDAAAPSNGGDAADVAADVEPAIHGDVRGHAEEHAVPRRPADGAGGPAAARDDSSGADGAEPIPPVADGDDAAGAEMKKI